MNQQTTFIKKYKPYFIRDFTDDTNFLDIVNTLIQFKNLNILFIGNINSGKTTLLDCIARQYYNLNENDNIPENNTLYINSLKEQGIQYFRNDMKTFCQSRSAIYGKKKIVLIDDIDSINEQSQQVFRNYIDKYSKNIHFISTCTNLQKVIESLQSRLHIIPIPKYSTSYIDKTMKNIMEKENMNLDKKVQTFILNNSNGSVRKMINSVEKCFVFDNNVTLSNCEKLCSTISFTHFDNYYNYLLKNNVKEATKILYEIYDYGYSVIDILDFLFYYTKKTELLEENIKYEVIILLCKYITIFHNVHEDCVELALITNNINKFFLS
jgi:DNA polymerase III delta prime subunit